MLQFEHRNVHCVRLAVGRRTEAGAINETLPQLATHLRCGGRWDL